MKFHTPLVAAVFISSLGAAEVPKALSGLFEQDTPIKAQIGMVLPPPAIDKFEAKIQAAARKDPKWFREYSTQAKNRYPLPWHENIGLTKEEYAEYMALWEKREFVPKENIMLLLRQSSGNWILTATGGGSAVTTLRYSEKDDIFRSPNGDLKRIADINADASTILGAWTGHEWKLEEQSTLGKTKENFAVGRFADNKNGIVVYHVQELSTEGALLLDKSIVIRFPLGKTKDTKSGTDTSKPPTKKSGNKK